MRTRRGVEYYCGTVNAKNRLGAYVGFRPFMLNADDLYVGEDSLTVVRINCVEPLSRNAAEVQPG
jgi:hypothetical protein